MICCANKENCFDGAGNLNSNATPAQLKSGFQWVCEYGRTPVVGFLLSRGVAIGEIHRGQTGLHWAAFGGHFEIVNLLLEKNPPLDVRDESWNNTPLGGALHGWAHPPTAANGGRHREIVSRLVAAGSPVESHWLAGKDTDINRDMR